MLLAIVFNPLLNLQKIAVFRSFQQNFEEINSLDQFSQEHILFFDQVTMAQMKDAATKVFNRKKTTALPELFTKELKVTIDSTIKRKFLELNDLQKLAFIKQFSRSF